MIYDVIIVGAGPVGCRVGELLGRDGVKVLILEEHSEIGRPVQCAGLVSHRIFELCDVSKDVVVNRVKKARFCTSKNYLELKSKKIVYVINREKFDKEMAKKAKSANTEIKTSKKFLGYKNGKFLRVKTDKEVFQTKLLVGADGPNSTVARIARIKLPNNRLTGIQTMVKSDYDPDSVELWFDTGVSPEFFGWVIPENKTQARVGLATKKNVVKCLDNFFLKRFNKRVKYIDVVGGTIRYGLIDNSVSDRMLLVGDAASQVKPFSGGGLVYGLICAEIAAKACVKTLEEGIYGNDFLKEIYDGVWKKKLSMPIRKGLAMSQIIHSFDSEQLGLLFSLFKKGKLTKLLEFTDMDLL